MKITPYLDFAGRCEEAVAFYTSALGAETLMLMKFSDAPDKSTIPPGSMNRVMHSALKIGETTIFAADGPGSPGGPFRGICLALNTSSVAECEEKFNALADGGTITQALIQTFFSERFGMVTDKFGVQWMINCTGK